MSPGERVVVADDDVLVREGIVSVLSGAGYEESGRQATRTNSSASSATKLPTLGPSTSR